MTPEPFHPGKIQTIIALGMFALLGFALMPDGSPLRKVLAGATFAAVGRMWGAWLDKRL